MRMTLVMTLLCVAAAACAPVQQVARTNPTVTYAHSAGDSAEADVLAVDYCRREYQSEVRVVARENSRTVYECLTH